MNPHRLAQRITTAVLARQPLQTPEDVRQTVAEVQDLLTGSQQPASSALVLVAVLASLLWYSLGILVGAYVLR